MLGECHCQVEKDFQATQSSLAEAGRNLRKLRRSRQHCESCAQLDDCPIVAKIRSEITTAIAELQEEWSGL